jgi:trimethylamine---corrinoid protein Co-methyltransferase
VTETQNRRRPLNRLLRLDHARRRGAGRRIGGRRRVPLDLVVDYFEEQGLNVVAVHEALDRLAEAHRGMGISHVAGIEARGFILGGAMGPVTNAGAIAQSLAETMAGCALTQLERPGAPVIFGNFLSSMSLRSGSPTFGTPEPAIGSMVVGQLARRLDLPLRCSGNFTTSKLPDAHAMNEGTMSMLAAIHCGANFILHAAGFLDGLLSMSYEKFVMDADFCGALHTYLDGVKIDDNELALDAFREVGPGNHFFGCAHTMANYESAFWDSRIADNEPFEKWEATGSEDAASRANRLWKKMLAEYQAPPLDEAIEEALRDFIARRKGAMDDAWY